MKGSMSWRRGATVLTQRRSYMVGEKAMRDDVADTQREVPPISSSISPRRYPAE